MPVAAVGAAATIGVGYLQHRSANNATKAQKQATDAALAHETSRESIADRRYNDAWADYQRRHAAWEARNFGGGAAAPARSASGGGQPAASMGPSPQTLQQMAAGPMTAAMGQTQDQAGSMADVSSGQGRTLQDLSRWNDWGALGLGG